MGVFPVSGISPMYIKHSQSHNQPICNFIPKHHRLCAVFSILEIFPP